MLRTYSLHGAGRVLALIVASSGMLFSQSSAVGTLSGTVSGSDRKPIPGALVRVDTGRGVLETRTNGKGHFLFSNLLPGSVTVQVNAEHRQAFKIQVNVLANQGTALNIPLHPINEIVVEVVANSSREVGVDPAVAVSGTNFTAEQINALPSIGGPYDAFLRTVPGTPSGGYNFHGSEDSANLYTVNGVESRSASGGIQMLAVNRELIEQFNVFSGGVSAKYGRFVGATVATVTKSGSNEFTGSMSHDLTSQSWNAVAKGTSLFPSERVPRHVSDVQSYTFLGPILKDTLFFTLGYRTTTPAKTTVVQGGVMSGLFPPFSFSDTQKDELRDIKLDWQINTDHRLSFAWNNHLVTTTAPNNGLGMSTIATGSGPTRIETGFYSLGYTGTLASNLVVDAIYSETIQKSGGRGTGSQGGTNVVTWLDKSWYDIYDNGMTTDALNQERIRTLGLNLTWVVGKHSVESGFQYYRSRIESTGSYDANYKSVTPSKALIEFSGWDATPPTMDRQYRQLAYDDVYSTRLTVFDPLSGSTDSRVWGLYINDVWAPDPHWTFNLGARYDANHFKTSPENKVFNIGAFVPRLAASYDLKGDRKHVFKLSLGEYAGQISSGTFSTISVANLSPSRYYAYFGTGHGSDALNADGSINWNVWGNSPTELGQASPRYASPDPLTSNKNVVDSHIKPPRSREATLSYRYTDPKNSLSATLLHKVQDRYIGMKRLGEPGLGTENASNYYYNDDGMKTRYENMEIQYRRQITGDLSAGGNITWSYTRANAGQATGTGSRNQYGDFISNDLVAPSGPQGGQWSSSTTPFTAHFDATYTHSFGKPGKLTVGLLGNYWSKSFRGYRAFTGPTDANVQDSGYSYYVTRVYSEEKTWWPRQYSLDLHLGYEVEVYRKVMFFTAFDVLNVLNHVMPMYVNYSTALKDSTTGTVYRPYVDPLPANWYNNPNLKPVGNNGYYKDGEVLAYTDPRTIQLRVGFRF